VENADDFINIGRYDWYVTATGTVLHAVTAFTQVHREDMARDWAVLHPVRLACGQMAAGVFIPGLFTRGNAMRCRKCCRKLRFPEGEGSPKNDPECRKILGLDTQENVNKTG
jgi:hypothetical protein